MAALEPELEPLIQEPLQEMAEDIEQMVRNGTLQKELESFKASAEKRSVTCCF